MGVNKNTRKFAQVGCHPGLTKIPTQNSLQVKRIIGQRDARLKKNQDKAVIESKRKSKDELVREMSVSTTFLESCLFNISQTPSLFISFLPIQYRYVSSSTTSLPDVRVPRPNHTGLVASDSSRG